MMNAEQTPTALARMRRREAREAQRLQDAFAALLGREANRKSVSLVVRGMVARISSTDEGRVTVLVDLGDGIEYLCGGDLSAGQLWRCPLPPGAAQILVVQLPRSSRVRSLVRVLQSATSWQRVVLTG